MAATGEQFIEVLEILEELNVQAQRLQEAASKAQLYLASESTGKETGDPDERHTGSGK